MFAELESWHSRKHFTHISAKSLCFFLAINLPVYYQFLLLRSPLGELLPSSPPPPLHPLPIFPWCWTLRLLPSNPPPWKSFPLIITYANIDTAFLSKNLIGRKKSFNFPFGWWFCQAASWTDSCHGWLLITQPRRPGSVSTAVPSMSFHQVFALSTNNEPAYTLEYFYCRLSVFVLLRHWSTLQVFTWRDTLVYSGRVVHKRPIKPCINISMYHCQSERLQESLIFQSISSVNASKPSLVIDNVCELI